MTSLDDAFVREHEPMIRKTAVGVSRALHMPHVVDDLVSVGFETLLGARERFDPSRGVPLSAYLYYRVRHAMLTDGRRIEGLPSKTLARVLRAGDAAVEELAEERGTRDDSGEADRITLGLETVFGQFTGALVCARLAEMEKTPELQLMHEMERARVRRAVAALPERERLLLFALYFEERVLDDIAPEIGLTKSGASRMHTRALAALRDALGPPS